MTEHARRMALLEEELSKAKTQQADSDHLKEQLQLQGQSAHAQRDQLLEKLQKSEEAVTRLEAEHRAL